MHHDRPDPAELLKQIQSEEQVRPRGQVKIFLGYAAGRQDRTGPGPPHPSYIRTEAGVGYRLLVDS